MYYTTFTGQWPCWFQRSDIWQRYGKTCCIQRCKQIASLSCYCCVFRWVHTCNVIAGLNSITLWVIETIWNYELNFHPMPHDVTESCECYTSGFPVCHGSPSDVFAASSGFVLLYTLCFKEKEKRVAVVAKATVHKQGTEQRFRFAGRLEFSVCQCVI